MQGQNPLCSFEATSLKPTALVYAIVLVMTSSERGGAAGGTPARICEARLISYRDDHLAGDLRAVPDPLLFSHREQNSTGNES